MNPNKLIPGQDGGILDNERYLPVIKLDTGGMAEVFLGAQFGEQNFERLVVIKRIHASHIHSTMARKMFISEARVVANLDHPHIVKIYELSKVGNEIGIIMEYVDGEPCSFIIESLRNIGGSIPLPVVLTIITQACEALGYAHRVKSPEGKELNLIHRDIDANNLMLDGRGYLKIIDFGIAKTSLSHDLTMIGQIKGKIDYLCPDILKHKDYDSRVDIYSLGLVFFEMLTMRKPLLAPEGAPFWQLADSVQSRSLPPPSTINAALPREIDGIVAKATEKDRTKRYQTAEAFAMDIRRFAKRYSELAPPNIVRAWFLGQFPKRLASRRDLERTVLAKAREIYSDHMARASTEQVDVDNTGSIDCEKIIKINDALNPESDDHLAAWSKPPDKHNSPPSGVKGRRANPYALLTLFFLFFIIGTLMIHQLFFADKPLWTALFAEERVGIPESNLFIASVPSHAEIYIDGKKIGNTGIAGKTTTIAPDKDHRIVIVKENFLPYEIVVQGVPFGQRRIEARLNPALIETQQEMEILETEIDDTPPAPIKVPPPKAPVPPKIKIFKPAWRPSPPKKAAPVPVPPQKKSAAAPSDVKNNNFEDTVQDAAGDGKVSPPENTPPAGEEKEIPKPSDRTAPKKESTAPPVNDKPVVPKPPAQTAPPKEPSPPEKDKPVIPKPPVKTAPSREPTAPGKDEPVPIV